MPAKKELKGQRFTRLLVMEEHPIRAKNGKVMWVCLCDCGNKVIVNNVSLTRGLTLSCGCYNREKSADQLRTHGKSNTRLYTVWQGIKSRCYYESDINYKYYGARGIKMSENFLKDFIAFEKELGPEPDTKSRWTVERINVELGYVEGNIRWATYSEQNRNKRKFSNNRSGVTGVYRKKGYKDEEYWVAQCHGLDGKTIEKYFSLSKYGDKAEEMAIQARKEMIEELNQQGAGYTATHGK